MTTEFDSDEVNLAVQIDLVAVPGKRTQNYRFIRSLFRDIAEMINCREMNSDGRVRPASSPAIPSQHPDMMPIRRMTPHRLGRL